MSFLNGLDTMTDKGKLMIDIAWRGSVDLVLGTFTATNIDNLMARLFKPPTTGLGYLAQIFVQLITTLWLSNDLRGLLVDNNSSDPTGGIVFIVSAFRQPTFWSNVDNAATALAQWIKSLFPLGSSSQKPQQVVNLKKSYD